MVRACSSNAFASGSTVLRKLPRLSFRTASAIFCSTDWPAAARRTPSAASSGVEDVCG